MKRIEPSTLPGAASISERRADFFRRHRIAAAARSTDHRRHLSGRAKITRRPHPDNGR